MWLCLGCNVSTIQTNYNSRWDQQFNVQTSNSFGTSCRLIVCCLHVFVWCCAVGVCCVFLFLPYINVKLMVCCLCVSCRAHLMLVLDRNVVKLQLRPEPRQEGPSMRKHTYVQATLVFAQNQCLPDLLHVFMILGFSLCFWAELVITYDNRSEVVDRMRQRSEKFVMY